MKCRTWEGDVQFMTASSGVPCSVLYVHYFCPFFFFFF
jgi:hypothetical protein